MEQMTEQSDLVESGGGVPAVGGLALEVLEAVICKGAANLTSAERDWLLAVAEFDRREGWSSWGCMSCAAWLSWQVGLDVRAAREKVRVARTLGDFPLISAAMGRGELSYSKVRAITRIVQPATEAALVDMALAGTTNHVERIVSAFRRAEQVELSTEQRHHERRGLHHSTDADGSMLITIRVPAEAGVAILSAVEQFVTADPPAPGEQIEPLAARRADAMVTLAEAGAASVQIGGGSSPYLVTMHLEPEALSDPGSAGRCEVMSLGDAIAHALGVPRATAYRLSCDADVEAVVADDQGNPLYMGRRSRVVRGSLRRAVAARDGCCRFPGCNRRGRVDAHHAVHWIDGGLTDIDNVLLLCRFHHRAVHEGGWHVLVDPAHGFVFQSPTGSTVEARPPRCTGQRDVIDRRGRTAADGRCRWGGEHLDHALTALFSQREAGLRTSRPSL